MSSAHMGDASNSAIVGTSDGSIVHNEYGFGVMLGGLYTPHDLYKRALEASSLYAPPADGISLYVAPDEHQFAWCPWSRLSLEAMSVLVERARMVSHPVFTVDDVTTTYAGCLGSYLDTWDQYYPLDARLGAIYKGTKRKSLVDLRILDAGCAGGRRMLEYAARGADVYGMEANKYHVQAAPTLIRPRITVGDVLSDLFVYPAASFNVCVCSCLGTVAQYDLPILLRELVRLIVPAGALILDVPSKFNIGDELAHSFRDYLAGLREAGFKPVYWYCDQIISQRI